MQYMSYYSSDVTMAQCITDVDNKVCYMYVYMLCSILTLCTAYMYYCMPIFLVICSIYERCIHNILIRHYIPLYTLIHTCYIGNIYSARS